MAYRSTALAMQALALPQPRALPFAIPHFAPHFQFLNAKQTRALWCGLEIELYEDPARSYWQGQRRVIRGPPVMTSLYDSRLHSWESWTRSHARLLGTGLWVDVLAL